MKNAGSPEAKVLSRFSPRIPASVAGVVPKSDGSTFTRYLNQPNRKSASSDGRQRVIDAVRQALVARIGDAAKADELVSAAVTEHLRAIAQEVAEAVAAERVQAVAQASVDAHVERFASKVSDPDATKLSMVPFSRPVALGDGISRSRASACGDSLP